MDNVCEVKTLRSGKEQFLALTTTLDQKASLAGSLRAIGLTCIETQHEGYIFGSIESLTTRHYTTGVDDRLGDEVFTVRIFDLSRMSFIGLPKIEEAIEDDIVANFHIQVKEEPFTEFKPIDSNPIAFLNCLAHKTDRNFIDVFFTYLDQVQALDFKLVGVVYEPDVFASLILVKDNVKVNVNYFIKDHFRNKKNYHFD